MDKRLLGILMTLVMVIMLFTGNAVFAAGGDVYISNSDANGGDRIDEGDDFDLELTIRNGSNALIENIWVSFGVGASFQPSESGRDKPFCDQIGAGEEAIATFQLFYTGGVDKNLPITITYTDDLGDLQSESTSIYIRNVREKKPEDTTPPTQRDPSKYKPVLELQPSAIPEGKTGDIITIPLTFTNTSKHEAKKIVITPKLEGIPFVLDQLTYYKTVESLATGKSITVDFQFSIDRNAVASTYSIPFEVDYTNVYSDDFNAITKNINIKIINTNLPARLVVREAKSSPSVIQEEQAFSVTFNVWNMGTVVAENVIVDIAHNDNFYVLDNITKQYIFDIKGLQYKEITYSLKPKKDLATGTYGITVSMLHDGIEKAEEFTMYVSVIGPEEEEEEEEEEKDDINIITTNVTTPQGSVLVEQPFTVSFNLENNGTTAAEAVKVTVEGGDKILPRSLNVLNISEMKPGETVPVAFSFIATKDSDSRTYPIKAIIEYKNNDEVIRKEQYMGVLIENPEKDKEEEEEEEDKTLNTVPKIIISEYSMDPVMVNAGENFTLRMKFLNTNNLKAVQNMKITLVVNESSEETGSVFSPVQSSNTFYIDYLAPGETSEKEMMMYTIPDAKAKTYVVKAIFEYEYEEKDQLKTNNMEDLFGIPVVQPAKLETSDVIVSEPAVMGEPVYISSEFYNMGKVTLSNLMVKVEGNFDTKEANYFVGNFDMGNSDYYEAPVTPLVPGETKGLLVFTFEDSSGMAHRIEKEFTVNAMESSPVMNPGFPGMEPGMDPGMMDPGMMGPQKSKFPLLPVGIGAGVVILIIVFIIIRRKRRKKKEMMLDEDI